MIFYRTAQIAEKTWQISEFGFDAMYYLEGEKQGILIDSGVGAGDVRNVMKTIASVPYTAAATHGHLDHMGGAYLFDSIYASKQAYDLFLSLSDRHRRNYIEELNNISEGFATNQTTDFLAPSGKIPKLVPVGTSDVIDLGGRTLSVFETPGHTTGCLSYLDSQTGILFSGDAIMSRLLFADDKADKMERLRLWYDNTKAVLEGKAKIKSVYTGHFGKITTSAVKELYALAEGVLFGAIPIHSHNGSAFAELGRTKIRFGWPEYSHLYFPK